MPILPNPRPTPGTTVDDAPAFHVKVSPSSSLLTGRYPLVMPVRAGVTYDALGPGTTEGSSYDYRAQSWRRGHDHCHLSTSHPQAQPLYCGADIDTCAPLPADAAQDDDDSSMLVTLILPPSPPDPADPALGAPFAPGSDAGHRLGVVARSAPGSEDERWVPVVATSQGVVYDALGPGCSQGRHYVPGARQWRPGHDHSHVSTTSSDAMAAWCRRDLDTCSPSTSIASHVAHIDLDDLELVPSVTVLDAASRVEVAIWTSHVGPADDLEAWDAAVDAELAAHGWRRLAATDHSSSRTYGYARISVTPAARSPRLGGIA